MEQFIVRTLDRKLLSPKLNADLILHSMQSFMYILIIIIGFYVFAGISSLCTVDRAVSCLRSAETAAAN